jgi:hypothetical protein
LGTAWIKFILLNKEICVSISVEEAFDKVYDLF